MTESAAHRSIPFREAFFCDGPFYVITSSNLGGSGLSAETVADILGEGREADVENLLRQGVCLPLFFPGDCAMDGAIARLGDLTQQESEEWIGRIVSKLKVPCGKVVVVCGGGDGAELEDALAGQGYNGFNGYFESFEIPSGDYQVEVYAYVSSMTVDLHFHEDEPLEDWFHQTRPGIALPKWLEQFKAEGYMGPLSNELVSYLIRFAPLESDPPLPELVEGIGWCGIFEFRRPELCPLGIERAALLSDE